MKGAWRILLLLLISTATVHAHGAHLRPPHEGPWWTAWNFWQPVVVVNLSAVSLLYAVGVWRLWRKAGVGKTISVRQVSLFASGMAVAVAALVSPIDVLSDELSWMHMIQHMLLMGVAAPLFVMGSPFLVSLWALPLSWRRKYGEMKRGWERWRPGRYLLWQPVLIWTVFAFTLWVWHLPSLYQATLEDDLFHDFQHFTFVIASCLYWRVLLDPVSRLRMSRGMGVMYLFFTSLHATVLGVFMTLAPKVWYPFYEDRAPLWHVSALEDQQIAGLIMWMPACMVYALVAAVTLGIWLRNDDQGELIRRSSEASEPPMKRE